MTGIISNGRISKPRWLTLWPFSHGPAHNAMATNEPQARWWQLHQTQLDRGRMHLLDGELPESIKHSTSDQLRDLVPEVWARTSPGFFTARRFLAWNFLLIHLFHLLVNEPSSYNCVRGDNICDSDSTCTRFLAHVAVPIASQLQQPETAQLHWFSVRKCTYRPFLRVHFTIFSP